MKLSISLEILMVHTLYMAIVLTLPLPNHLVPTPYTKKGGSLDPPAISKAIAPMNLKFCSVLETLPWIRVS